MAQTGLWIQRRASNLASHRTQVLKIQQIVHSAKRGVFRGIGQLAGEALGPGDYKGEQ